MISPPPAITPVTLVLVYCVAVVVIEVSVLVPFTVAVSTNVVLVELW